GTDVLNMKRKRTTCLKSSSSQQQLLSSPKSTVMDEDDFYLPDECWEDVFKFLMMDEDNNSHYQYRHYLKLESLSLVSVKVQRETQNNG
ncbi:F-box/LRR-repeat protein, partial [Trifolium medium]|nr:F-box/LRR-repeat protein [Trifolium medium]